MHVGVRVLLVCDPFAELGGLVVSSAHRRRGIGGALVMRAIRWTRAHELTTLRLRSNVVRPEAHAFDPSLGFARAKTSHTYELSMSASEWVAHGGT